MAETKIVRVWMTHGMPGISRTKVYAEMSSGVEGLLFDFDPCDEEFRESDFIGLTRRQAMERADRPCVEG